MASDFLHALRAQSVDVWFNNEYEASKALFIKQYKGLTAVPWQKNSWSLPASVAFTTDAVWIGNIDAQFVLVFISGTHGIEGYCGSAAQSFIIECLEQGWLTLPNNTAILMVHALNPWGMAWARRCDQDGVDINRNFIDFTNIPAAHPKYDQVLRRLVFEDHDQRQLAIEQLVETLGQAEFDSIFSGGQYHCSWAPFFGGHRVSFSSHVIDNIIDYWKMDQRKLVVIDLHSGLGPWAFGELISDHPANSPGNRFARSLFGNAVAETDKGESFSVRKNGLLDYRWHRMMQNDSCFLTLEFGTSGTSNLFSVLIDEHLFWRDWTQPDQHDSSYLKQRQAMLDHFCPRNSLWQQAVLFKTWQVTECVFQAVST